MADFVIAIVLVMEITIAIVMDLTVIAAEATLVPFAKNLHFVLVLFATATAWAAQYATVIATADYVM